MDLVYRVGLLCMIIDGSKDHRVVGRLRLQKTAYFCKCLGWNVGHYQLHYYGPFSFELTDTIQTAESVELIEQGSTVPHTFELTDKGQHVMNKFTKNVCNSTKVKDTRRLITYLSKLGTKEIELVTTMDYVNANTSNIKKYDLVEKVHKIKGNFTFKQIKKAYDKWKKLKKHTSQYRNHIMNT